LSLKPSCCLVYFCYLFKVVDTGSGFGEIHKPTSNGELDKDTSVTLLDQQGSSDRRLAGIQENFEFYGEGYCRPSDETLIQSNFYRQEKVSASEDIEWCAKTCYETSINDTKLDKFLGFSMYNGTNLQGDLACHCKFTVDGTKFSSSNGDEGTAFCYEWSQTEAPSSPPTLSPTVSPFSWNIKGPDNNGWTVGFSDTSSGNSEINGIYTMTSTRMFFFKVFERDCKTNLQENDGISILASSGTVDATGKVAIDINIDEALIGDSSVMTIDTESYKNKIEICVRASLETEGALEVNFHETILIIDVDMTADFSIEAITQRTNATDVDKEASLNYTNSAYICDEAVEGNSSTWTEVVGAAKKQGDLLQVCYEINNGGVTPTRVLEWKMSSSGQDGTDNSTLTDIGIARDGGSSDLGSVSSTLCEGNKCLIKSVILAKHFAAARFDGNTKPTLRVDGEILLQFGDETRRLVRANDVALRALQDSTESQFNVEVGLEGDSLLGPQTENDSSAVFSSPGAVTLVALLIGGGLFAF